MNLQRLRTAPRPLLLLSAFLFGTAYFAVRFPDVPGAGVVSFVCTLLIASPSFAALWRFFGARKTVLSLLCLSTFGLAIETIGVVSGFPYGSFYYADSLGPKVAGLVPYLLPLSWTPLVLGAVAATGPRGKTGLRRRVLPAFSAAILLTLMDVVLDPGATALGFWVWPEGGIYFGVPITNYFGWLFSSSLGATILLALGGSRWENASPPPGLLDSAIIAVAFWSGIALFSSLLFTAVLGIALFLYLLYRRTQLASAKLRSRWCSGRGITVRERVMNGS